MGVAAGSVSVLEVSRRMRGTAALCISTVSVGAATDRFGIRRVAVPLLLLLIAATYGLYIGSERLSSALLPLCGRTG